MKKNIKYLGRMRIMQNLELEAETLQISIYSNIVQNILKKHMVLSLNKIMLFSYLIKKDRFRLGKVYTANNTQDIVCKAISLISGEYLEYCDNVNFILKAVHLLLVNNKIKMEGNLLYLSDEIDTKRGIYQESPFIEKAIEVSKKMSDRQFMKEVIANV